MPVNLMRRCCFYFLGFLVAVMTATASRLSDMDLKLDAQTEFAAEIMPVSQDPCVLPECSNPQIGSNCPDYKQEP